MIIPKTKNWSRGQCRKPTEIDTLYGTVCEWSHDETGDTVSIMLYNEGIRRYDISHNDETITARNTYNQAKSSVIDTLRQHPRGLND